MFLVVITLEVLGFTITILECKFTLTDFLVGDNEEFYYNHTGM